MADRDVARGIRLKGGKHFTKPNLNGMTKRVFTPYSDNFRESLPIGPRLEGGGALWHGFFQNTCAIFIE